MKEMSVGRDVMDQEKKGHCMMRKQNARKGSQ